MLSFDNIDVLENTVDGKNTFHCTQCVLWQRGPAPKEERTLKSIERCRTPDTKLLRKLHELDKALATTGTRPPPLIHGEINFNRWFEGGTDTRKLPMALDRAWVLSRMNLPDKKQNVPSWAVFNEAVRVSDAPVTTTGMMPILQAPADENNTVATVLNQMQRLSNHLGQTFTIIIADQPLYSSSQELVWSQPDNYKNVMLMMGDLHITFSFLRAIGQHMEGVGIDDIWVESGAFAKNSTSAMMEGKAYYRAVHGHQLLYEALSRIKWESFQMWAEARLPRKRLMNMYPNSNSCSNQRRQALNSQ